ncbi:very short patch repair endonuclease [soil metagenome]
MTGKTSDVHTRKQRSRNMSAIRAKNTKPEMIVRRLVHRMGYRYRLHGKALPGRPDLVFASRQKVVLVHGCFWHCHDCRFGTVTPRTNAMFWSEKRAANSARDQRNLEALAASGWKVLVLWECELWDDDRIRDRLLTFLGPR